MGVPPSDLQNVEEKIRKPADSRRVSEKQFSIARSSPGSERGKNAGITIQVRLKNTVSARLLSRKNTEYWLSATD